MTSIAGDLFQERIQQQPADAGRWKMVVLVVVASLATFVGTWYMLKGNKQKNAPIPGSAALREAPAAVAALPAPPVAAPAPAQPAPAPPAAPAVANVMPPALSSPLSTGEGADEESRPARTAKKLPRQPAPPVASPQLKPLPQTVQAPADIKLSGIAWQDERGARRAVVNGFLLKEGAVVSGSKITEILADRVRFASPGGSFEIRLDAATLPEGRR